MASRPGTRASSAALLSKRTPSFRSAVALASWQRYVHGSLPITEPLRLGRGSRVFEDIDNGISRAWPPPTGRSVSLANRQTPDSKAPAQSDIANETTQKRGKATRCAVSSGHAPRQRRQGEWQCLGGRASSHLSLPYRSARPLTSIIPTRSRMLRITLSASPSPSRHVKAIAPADAASATRLGGTFGGPSPGLTVPSLRRSTISGGG